MRAHILKSFLLSCQLDKTDIINECQSAFKPLLLICWGHFPTAVLQWCQNVRSKSRSLGCFCMPTKNMAILNYPERMKSLLHLVVIWLKRKKNTHPFLSALLHSLLRFQSLPPPPFSQSSMATSRLDHNISLIYLSSVRGSTHSRRAGAHTQLLLRFPVLLKGFITQASLVCPNVCVLQLWEEQVYDQS